MRFVVGGLLLLGFAVFITGCATPAIDSARYDFYRGNLDGAEERLAEATVQEKDRVLYLMERATVLQMQGRYDESSRYYIEAYNQLEDLETYSVSKGGASLVINDGVQDFKGTPYERTMLHVFTAKNHLARGDWENAAVEARRIIQSMTVEAKDDYPDDAYSRYMAGFCLEMLDDPSNAALQYRKATEASDRIEVNELNGHIRPKTPPVTEEEAEADPANPADSPAQAKGPADAPPWPVERWPHELVCFIMVGRAPGSSFGWDAGWSAGAAPYAEIRHDGEVLGRSYALADTAELAYRTAKKQAGFKAAKTVTRVAIKEAAAQAIEHETNEVVGELVRLILIGLLEQPDIRRWGTLPRWLQVARVPCPEDLEAFEVHIKNSAGRTVQTLHISDPIQRHGSTYVSFCRDLPIPSTLPPIAGE
jgi:hypothetical protein